MRKAKANLTLLFIAFLVLLIGVVVVKANTVVVEREYSHVQRKAAEIMRDAEGVLKNEILSRGLEIEDADFNSIGLIGPDWSEIVTTSGDVKAKRTTLNPEFAAAMVRYMVEGGVRKGDTIAVGSSGSFPGLLVAVLSASTAMGLDVKIIPSLGASMYGASRVEFNIFDILETLRDKAGLDFTVLAVSMGGERDKGGGAMEGFLYDDTLSLFLSLTEKASITFGVPFLYFESLEENIEKRRELYGDDIAMFVNIGGASANSGESAYTLDFPQGLVLEPPRVPDVPEKGLNYIFSEEGVPVLNLLNVKLLSGENSIDFDPYPVVWNENGEVYYTLSYSRPLAVFFILLYLILVSASIWKRRKDGHNKTSVMQ